MLWDPVQKKIKARYKKDGKIMQINKNETFDYVKAIGLDLMVL